jgi:hypothetical protein
LDREMDAKNVLTASRRREAATAVSRSDGTFWHPDMAPTGLAGSAGLETQVSNAGPRPPAPAFGLLRGCQETLRKAKDSRKQLLRPVAVLPMFGLPSL